MKTNILVFDVESIGLHGPAFAVGWVLIDFKGDTVDEGILACDPNRLRNRGYTPDKDDLAWVTENVEISTYNCDCPKEMRDRFWKMLDPIRQTTMLAADVPWPVEANFLSQCINDDLAIRKWHGPYPLLDIASYRLARGDAAMATQPRQTNELPAHNPLNDARQSARQLMNSGGVMSLMEL